MTLFILAFIIGGLFGFFIAACLGANKEVSYTEEFLFHELCDFKRYWIEYLPDEADQRLAKMIVEDFMLGLMNGFRRED